MPVSHPCAHEPSYVAIKPVLLLDCPVDPVMFFRYKDRSPSYRLCALFVTELEPLRLRLEVGRYICWRCETSELCIVSGALNEPTIETSFRRSAFRAVIVPTIRIHDLLRTIPAIIAKQKGRLRCAFSLPENANSQKSFQPRYPIRFAKVFLHQFRIHRGICYSVRK